MCSEELAQAWSHGCLIRAVSVNYANAARLWCNAPYLVALGIGSNKSGHVNVGRNTLCIEPPRTSGASIDVAWDHVLQLDTCVFVRYGDSNEQ